MIHVLANSWLLYALCALLSISCYSLFTKKVLTKDVGVEPMLLSAVVFLFVGLAATGIYFMVGDLRRDLRLLAAPGCLGIALANVVFYSVGAGFYYPSLKALPVSQVAIIHSLVGVHALIMEAFLGVGAVSRTRVGGAGLIVLSVALVSGSQEASKFSRATGILLLSTLFHAGAVLTDQHLVSRAGLSSLFVLSMAYLVPAMILLFYCMVVRKTTGKDVLRLLRTKFIYVNAAVILVAYMCVYHAYAIGAKSSGVNLILSAEAVLVVLLSMLFLNERENLLVKLLASVMAVAGMYLLSVAALFP